MTRKIMSSLLVIALAALLIGLGTFAQFSDTETSTGNTFTAGTLNLTVENPDPTTAKFTISDVKPGDTDLTAASWKVKNVGSLDGYLDITFKNLVNDEGTLVEPEESEGDTGGPGAPSNDGELAAVLNLVITIDGTTVYSGMASGIVSEKLSDYALGKGVEKTFVIKYSIDSGVGNTIQSDVVGFDIEFELAQTADQ